MGYTCLSSKKTNLHSIDNKRQKCRRSLIKLESKFRHSSKNNVK